MVITKLAFLNRFTADETAAIISASDVSPAIRVYLFKLQVASEVNVENPDTIAGIQQLELAGLIGPGRAAEILSPVAPTSTTPNTGLSKSWDIMDDDTGQVRLTVIADAAVRGVSIEHVNDWYSYVKINQLVNTLNAANAWLLENGGVI